MISSANLTNHDSERMSPEMLYSVIKVCEFRKMIFSRACAEWRRRIHFDAIPLVIYHREMMPGHFVLIVIENIHLQKAKLQHVIDYIQEYLTKFRDI